MRSRNRAIPEDPALTARIKSYELAYKMQTTVPAVFNFKEEPEHVRKMYGLDQEKTRTFGERCLAARRLVEQGVRFVQVYHGGGGKNEWDAHSELQKNHSKLCAEVDLPIAGLLKDLKQRGLLDETIVVWGTEFGRTPGVEGLRGGRDHHPYGFTAWMAGAGVKRGIIHGATDELGFHAVREPALCDGPPRDGVAPARARAEAVGCPGSKAAGCGLWRADQRDTGLTR